MKNAKMSLKFPNRKTYVSFIKLKKGKISSRNLRIKKVTAQARH